MVDISLRLPQNISVCYADLDGVVVDAPDPERKTPRLDYVRLQELRQRAAEYRHIFYDEPVEPALQDFLYEWSTGNPPYALYDTDCLKDYYVYFGRRPKFEHGVFSNSLLRTLENNHKVVYVPPESPVDERVGILNYAFHMDTVRHSIEKERGRV